MAALVVPAAIAGPDPEGTAAPPPAPTTVSSGPCATPMRAGTTSVTVQSDGLTRRATVHMPPGMRARRRAPLVVALAGAGQTGGAFAAYSGLSRLADRFGYAVVYPTAWGQRPFWNMNGRVAGKPDDVRFIARLLDALEDRLCLDVTRFYATGVSNGGGMTARLGCALSERFAAIAPVAGGYSSLPPCDADRPVSVLEIHGTADSVVPYEGKGPAHAGRVSDYLRDWAERDRCPRPSRRQLTRTAVRLDWRPCMQGSAVAHLRLIGGLHAWPGSTPPPGGPSSGVSASKAALSFFHRFVLATAPADF